MDHLTIHCGHVIYHVLKVTGCHGCAFPELPELRLSSSPAVINHYDATPKPCLFNPSSEPLRTGKNIRLALKELRIMEFGHKGVLNEGEPS